MFEEAISTVVTVRDFSLVFDAYAQFEESMIAAKMETQVLAVRVPMRIPAARRVR